MTYIVILIIVAFALWKGKPYLTGYIIKKRNEKKPIEVVNTDLVYVPVISSRTFTFAIEIKEVGGGKAIVTVVKDKNLIS